MSSVIRTYKQSIADILLGDPNFANVPVLVKISKEILSQINIGLAPLQGINVIIGGLSGRNLSPNLPGPRFDETSLAVDIVENVTVNESNNGLDCDDLGELAAALIHQNPAINSNELPEVIDWVEVEDTQYSIRRLMVKSPLGFLYQPPAIAPVVPSVAAPGAQSVTLSCATAGAAIFFTLDGSYPAPRNPSSQLFGVPSGVPLGLESGGDLGSELGQPISTEQGATTVIAVSAGQLLRARAWLAGYAASNPTELNQQY